jgi:hypothetical protein
MNFGSHLMAPDTKFGFMTRSAWAWKMPAELQQVDLSTEESVSLNKQPQSAGLGKEAQRSAKLVKKQLKTRNGQKAVR